MTGKMRDAGPMISKSSSSAGFQGSRSLRLGASLVAQMIKNLPAIQESRVQSLGREDPLENGMATPIFMSGESHGQRSPSGYSLPGCKEADTTERLTFSHRSPKTPPPPQVVGS